MSDKLNARKINPDAYKAMSTVSASTTSLDRRLKCLVEIRASQINGCAFCLDMHIREARELGESQQRLDCLAGWRDMPSFSERERMALEWTEAVTRIDRHRPSDELHDRLRTLFTERELVDLTVTAAIINAWNRLSISTHREPDVRESYPGAGADR